MNAYKVSDHLKEKTKDLYFKELYELEVQKYVIVEKIVEYRIKHKMTQGQLAEQVGVTQQQVSKVENGEFSSVMTLEKILLAIGMWQLGIILLVLLFPILALVSVLKNDFPGNERIIWILLIIFLPILGAILYFLIGRNKRLKK